MRSGDATRLLDIVTGKGSADARELARRAYTAWARDYRELMHLGRYLDRDRPDVLARFPGIHAERTARRNSDPAGEDSPPAGNPPGPSEPAAE